MRAVSNYAAACPLSVQIWLPLFVPWIDWFNWFIAFNFDLTTPRMVELEGAPGLGRIPRAK